MSHNSSEPKICPNCGYPAVENYCAQCGQETHLHKDTVIALIMHFAGHYLHYDSKFWQTLRTLWFSPGLLTTAYWEEKRMRYIPPISLYIFVSFIYFFTSSLTAHKWEKSDEADKNKVAQYSCLNSAPDTTSHKHIKTEISLPSNDQIKLTINFTADSSKAEDELIHNINYFTGLHINYKNLKKNHPDIITYITEEVVHFYPKVFFFMIPIMALILDLLFFRRKAVTYVNHVIFSLHYHALWFSLQWIEKINPIERISILLGFIIMICSVVYLILALKNAYQIKTFRAILYSIVISLFYIIFLLIACFAVFLIVLSMAC